MCFIARVFPIITRQHFPAKYFTQTADASFKLQQISLMCKIQMVPPSLLCTEMTFCAQNREQTAKNIQNTSEPTSSHVFQHYLSLNLTAQLLPALTGYDLGFNGHLSAMLYQFENAGLSSRHKYFIVILL